MEQISKDNISNNYIQTNKYQCKAHQEEISYFICANTNCKNYFKVCCHECIQQAHKNDKVKDIFDIEQVLKALNQDFENNLECFQINLNKSMEIIIKLSKELQVKIGEITEISNSMLNNTLELKNNSDLLVKQIFDSIQSNKSQDEFQKDLDQLKTHIKVKGNNIQLVYPQILFEAFNIQIEQSQDILKLIEQNVSKLLKDASVKQLKEPLQNYYQIQQQK